MISRRQLRFINFVNMAGNFQTTKRTPTNTRQRTIGGSLRFCCRSQTQQMLKCCVLYGVFLLLVPDFIVALKDVSVTIPQAVKRGSNALLQCNYDMENDTLYSVKWYKGRREFYRYTPKENPAMKVFPMTSGLNVERNLSNQSHVVLLAVPLNISGKFTCEISVEAPSFQTAMVSGEMEVVELPEEPTTVTGIQPRYRIGDLVDGNCSIKFSKPAANLTWTINGIVVPPHHIKTYQIEKHEDSNLESVVSAVHFMVTTTHFLKGQMRLKCTATIFDIFKEEIESVIEEDRPRIMASGRSYDINNYPYEQHSSGDGFEDHNESYLTYYSAADITSSSMRMTPPSAFLWLHSMQKWLGLCLRQAVMFGKKVNSMIAAITLTTSMCGFFLLLSLLLGKTATRKCQKSDGNILQWQTEKGYMHAKSWCCQRLSSSTATATTPTPTTKSKSSSSPLSSATSGEKRNCIEASVSWDQTLLMAYTVAGVAKKFAPSLC